MTTILADGLYRVDNGNFCAGFVVHNGQITMCAPILRKSIDYWITIAEKID